MSDVARGPGTDRDIQPGDRKDTEQRAHGFMKELLEGAPHAAKTALRRRVDLCGCGHVNILTQKTRGRAKRNLGDTRVFL